MMGGATPLLSFAVHGLRRSLHVARTMRRFLAFDAMLLQLSPVAGRPYATPHSLDEAGVARIAECFAVCFPWLWKRRCLFRSLLVLDWARQRGLDPTLNVGMELGLHQDQGHCWLSLGDRPFCERIGWPGRYGALFHQSKDVHYWTSLAAGTIRGSVSLPGRKQEGELDGSRHRC